MRKISNSLINIFVKTKQEITFTEMLL